MDGPDIVEIATCTGQKCKGIFGLASGYTQEVREDSHHQHLPYCGVAVSVQFGQCLRTDGSIPNSPFPQCISPKLDPVEKPRFPNLHNVPGTSSWSPHRDNPNIQYESHSILRSHSNRRSGSHCKIEHMIGRWHDIIAHVTAAMFPHHMLNLDVRTYSYISRGWESSWREWNISMWVQQ